MDLYKGPARNQSAVQPATDTGGFLLLVILAAICFLALAS